MNAAIKIDPKQLPAPKLPPTHSVRVNKPDWISIHCEKHERRQREHTGTALDPVEEQKTINAFYSGLKPKEAAKQLGISPVTYTKRIQRLKKRGAI